MVAVAVPVVMLVMAVMVLVFDVGIGALVGRIWGGVRHGRRTVVRDHSHLWRGGMRGGWRS